MSVSRVRLLLLIAALPVVVFIAALIYMAGMEHLEGDPRDFLQSLSWAAETFTTTGYGADVRWQHPAMVLFVILLQFFGVFLVFLVFPIYLIPVLEERFEARLPRKAPELSDHLLIFRHGPAVESLMDEAEALGVPYLILEPDETVARRVFERGRPVLVGEVDSGALEAAGLDRARALIANGTDDEDAAVVLAARQLGFEKEVLVLVEEPYHRRPMMLAGASAVFTPRHILGAALAARASARISPRVAGIQKLGGLLVREVRLQPGSPLAGLSLADADLGARTGATVIGQWVDGHLAAPVSPRTRLETQGILVVVGSEDALDRLVELCGSAVALRQTGLFLIGGFGEVGRKVGQLMEDAGEEVVVVDRVPGEGVDVVGDVLDPGVLEKAGVHDAQAAVLALDTDSATLFATVILKDLVPQLSVIARVNQAENLERMYRAGADFALSISQVSGQMLAQRLLGEESVALDPQLRLAKVPATGLVGRPLATLAIRERTRASVVAVERDGDVQVELGPDFEFRDDDTVYLCGSGAAVRRFQEEFHQSPPG